MTDAEAVRTAGREAARRKLRELFAGQIAESVADQIADAALDYALPLAEGLRLFELGHPDSNHPVDWQLYNAVHLRSLRTERLPEEIESWASDWGIEDERSYPELRRIIDDAKRKR